MARPGGWWNQALLLWAASADGGDHRRKVHKLHCTAILVGYFTPYVNVGRADCLFSRRFSLTATLCCMFFYKLDVLGRRTKNASKIYLSF